ncbi:MAG: hypothetical protein M3083_00970 [Actinomycetota bacterium]|nr:hypothetical protein [Actinomycetota bacterium]
MILAFGGQWGLGAWLWLLVPVGVYAVITLGLFVMGPPQPTMRTFFFGQISDSLRRATGFPGWSMAGVLSGLWSLLVLVIGFYWDVAWHIDNGRDTQLFTVPHVMILVGLAGLIYTAGLTVLFASLEDADVGLRIGPVRVPWSALLLLALGGGAIAAFPLDNLWHKAYGIDVTLWSPTHLQLVAGGSLGTIGLFLLCAEALPFARPSQLGRGIYALTTGTMLVGLSTFQGEFDFGVPQFQALYFPLLITAAAAVALVVARVALGRWGAVKVALSYLLLRGFIALVVGGALHHSVPRFPLYLPSALAVELAAWWVGEGRRLRLAVAAGTLVGTLGLVGELAWVRLSGWSSYTPSLSLAAKTALLGPVVALAAAVLGAGLARAAARDEDHIPLGALVLAGVVLIGILAYPLPRRVGHVDAVVRLQSAGSQALVAVDLTPADAASHADAFNVTSWQGGGKVSAALTQVSPGHYRTTRSVPISGHWKTTVNLFRGDQLMAAPVYLPADPSIGAPAIPAVAERRVSFVKNVALLLREQHPGPAWPSVAAWSGLGTLVALWMALIALCASRPRRAVGHIEPRDTHVAWSPPAPVVASPAQVSRV